MKMFGMCINWKVIAGLAAVGVGVVLVIPGYAGAVLPLLILAVCPLSMVAMMFAMRGMGAGHESHEREPQRPEALQQRLFELRAEEAAIERELAARSDMGSVAPAQELLATPREARA